MGIDYDANFGIGYEVEASDAAKDSEEFEDGLGDYLYNAANGVESLTCGSYYSGDCTHFLVIRDPFKDGLDLTKGKSDLEDEIKRLKLITVGEFGEVGGVLVS